MAGSGFKRSIGAVGQFLVGVGSLAGLVVIVIWLEREWRAGRAFTAYRNGEGHMVRLADLLILIGCIIPLRGAREIGGRRFGEQLGTAVRANACGR